MAALAAQYAAFARRHAATLSAVEGVVQSAAWLAPEGEASDFVLEGLSALMGILGVLNEHVAAGDDAAGAGCGPAAAAGAPHQHQHLSLCVRVLHQLEVLAEMGAQRALGADGKWSALAGLETLKALLRLALLRRCGGCVLVGDVAPSTSLRRAPPWASPAQRAADAALRSRERAERTLRALAAFRRGRALTACSLAPAPPAPSLHALAEVHRRRVLLAGEALRVLRPVMYCLAVSRFGRRSWRPWLAALAMDLSSDALLRRVPLDADERAELQRRRSMLAYYLLFSPAYEVTVQPPLHALRRAAAPLPLLGTLTDKMTELLEATLSMHAYTSSG